MWTYAFSTRSLTLNKRHLRNIRQKLADDSQHLHTLYTDQQTGHGPIQQLESLVGGATGQCDDACALHKEVSSSRSILE